MESIRFGVRRAFTLIELLVVIAIIAVLIGLLLPAVQQVREASARSKCTNNLKQLSTAVHNFHSVHGSFPTYHGIFPITNNSIAQGANNRAVFGSWFVHITPFVEQGAFYDKLASDAAQYTNGSSVNIPASGVLVSAAVPAVYDYSGSTLIPAVPGTVQWVQVTNANGYTLWVQQTTGGTAAYWSPAPILISPAQPAVYDPPGSGPRSGPNGIWYPEYKEQIFSVLQCPSDPSAGDPSGRAGHGHVYRNETPPWGGTSYLANYNCFTTGKGGINALPQNFLTVTDGLSNTVMFGEGYQQCDGRGRRALYTWDTHNFGITFAFNNVLLNDPSSPVLNYPNGMPNPCPNETESSSVNFKFQIKPLARALGQCPAGKICCNNLTGQSNHSVYNIALADGSVRAVTASLSDDTWRQAMLPRDGEPLGSDW